MLSLASVPHSFGNLEYLPPQLAFLTSTDGSIIGDSVSPHTFTQHSFEDLQSLLLLPDFLTSTDGNTVSDSVSISGSGSGSGSGNGTCSSSGKALFQDKQYLKGTI